MVKKIKKYLKKIRVHRTSIVIVCFFLTSFILVQRLFSLQIIHGEDYLNNFYMKTKKERSINSTRGNIYDKNGILLAYNKLSYSVTIEDNGSYDTTRSKNMALNSEAAEILKILRANDSDINIDFHIIIDDDGKYAFDVEGTNLNRFRADVYGEAKIENMTAKQAESSATDIMKYLSGEERFALTNKVNPYTKAEKEKYGLPDKYTKQECLDIVKIRYALFTTSYRKYLPVTIATNVGDTAVAALMENETALQGIDIVEDSVRVYNDSQFFSSITGYTGKASAEELADLQKESPEKGYASGAVVGKAGIESAMETTLQGVNGKEVVYVDNLGKVMEISDQDRIEPKSGDNVCLTIDHDLQVATYKILEQKIAGILVSTIRNVKDLDTSKLEDTEDMFTPIYDVYNALIKNNVIDIDHFTATDASPTESAMYETLKQKQAEIFASIKQELEGASPSACKDLSPEMQDYMTYIVDDLLTTDTGILNDSAIDKTNEKYLAWTRDGSISLQQYLTYAASQNWIDISSIPSQDSYPDSTEVYAMLSSYITDYLATDKSFDRLLYKYMIKDDQISGEQICTILYDQGVLDKTDGTYESFLSGQVSAYDLMIAKITSLEITPASLALDPCSGSVVVTDPSNGEVLACVTYPGYDSNRLSGDMDIAYYNKLVGDYSQPFYNKATQERTAPGSTFKLISTVAGLSEKVIDTRTTFNCTGVFGLTETPLRCWNRSGHGRLSIVPAISNSCNVFFCNVAYQLGQDEMHVFSNNIALQKLMTYSKLFNMDKKSGLEIVEEEPQVSDQYAIQSVIGQGTHLYTTSQLARYVTSLANSGTSYNLSMIDKTTDSDGETLEDRSADIESKISLPDEIWNVVHQGMREVITNNVTGFGDLRVTLSGKTGTAQVSKTRPNHGLFIGYTSDTDRDIALAVRISNGYNSSNASSVAKDVIRYYYKLAEPSEIITGKAAVEATSNVTAD